jgi:hypothetical protein
MESRAAVFREVGAPVSIEHITLDPPRGCADLDAGKNLRVVVFDG